MTTDGGGWTVFQKRIDGSVSFERGWADYKTGFGDLNGEFWLGNDYLHRFTTGYFYMMRIRIHDWAGSMVYAEYPVFTVGDETSNYMLTLKGPYKGDDGNAMSAHNSRSFSTFDRDNDVSASNCAADHKGGFWFTSCIENGANPNGAYLGNVINQEGIVWKSWKNSFENVKTVQMMLRPPNYGKLKNRTIRLRARGFFRLIVSEGFVPSHAATKSYTNQERGV
jgi:ficolin